jgi:hypothetical protein
MRLFGLADRRLAGSDLGEVIETYVRREDAEGDLADALRDEPTWKDFLYVVEIEGPPGPSLSSEM